MKIFAPSTQQKYTRLAATLKNAGVSLSKLERMDSEALRTVRTELSESLERQKANIPLGKALHKPSIQKQRMIIDAVNLLIEQKLETENVKLVRGMTYYDVKKRGKLLEGVKCVYKGKDSRWVFLNSDVRALKALEILRNGSDENFRKIYFEMADGAPIDSLTKYIPEHVTKSSPEALDLMEQYADSLWTGPWPWDIKAAPKLKKLIKENMMKSLKHFRQEFTKYDTMLTEGEVEQSEVVSQLLGLSDTIEKDIKRMGNVAGEVLAQIRDKVRTEFGEESLTGLENVIDKFKGAVDGLSEVKNSIDEQVKSLIGSESPSEFDSGLGGMDQMDLDNPMSDPGERDDMMNLDEPLDDEVIDDDDDFTFTDQDFELDDEEDEDEDEEDKPERKKK